MIKKLTLSQMAEQYSRSTKTFKKYVHELGIPHVKLGRDMLFDPHKVDAFLTAHTESRAVAGKAVAGRKRRSLPSVSKFAGALG